MKYRTYKAVLRDAEDSLGRTFCIREDASLLEMSIAFLMSLEAAITSDFQIQAGKAVFVPEEGTDNYMDDVLAEELPDSFVFEYEDSWIFDFSGGESEDRLDYRTFILLSGNGAGIWEDDFDGYMSYVNGEIPKELTRSIPEKGIFLPENLFLESFGDTDVFDLLYSQRMIDSNLEETVDRFPSLSQMDDDDIFGDRNPLRKLWSFFEELYLSTDDTKNENSLRADAEDLYNEFFRVIESMNNLDIKPENFEDLFSVCGAPACVFTLIDEELFDLLDRGEYRFALDCIERLTDEFSFMDEEYITLQLAKIVCMTSMDMGQEALFEAETLYRMYPGYTATAAMLAKTYTSLGDYEEALQMIRQFIPQGTECTDENVGMFIAADELLEKQPDMLEELEWVREPLDAYQAKRIRESITDEYAPAFLEYSVEQCRLINDEANEMILLFALRMMADSGNMLYLMLKDEGIPDIYFDVDADLYLKTYTDEDLVPDGYDISCMTVEEITDFVRETGLSGIVINDDDRYDELIFVTLDQLETLASLGDIPEDELPDISRMS